MRMKLRYLLLLSVMLLINSNASAQYVVSAKSEKYHKESCQHAKRILDENRVEFKTIEEAKEAGYIACKVCKPGGASISPSTKVKSDDKPKEAGGRCQATTKKGTQCKRNASAGSSYCWQHGG